LIEPEPREGRKWKGDRTSSIPRKGPVVPGSQKKREPRRQSRLAAGGERGERIETSQAYSRREAFFCQRKRKKKAPKREVRLPCGSGYKRLQEGKEKETRIHKPAVIGESGRKGRSEYRGEY